MRYGAQRSLPLRGPAKDEARTHSVEPIRVPQRHTTGIERRQTGDRFPAEPIADRRGRDREHA